MNNGILLLIIPLAAVFIIPAGTVISKGFGRFVSLISFTAAALYGIYLFPSVLESSVSIISGNWSPPFGINLFLSPFSLGVVILIYFSAVMIIINDLTVKRKSGQYYLLYTLFVFASAGMVLTGDIFNLFVFLEIGGISAFALIASENRASGSSGSLKYLIQAQTASLAMLAGIALVYSASGVLNIAVLSNFSMFNPAFAFLTLGLLIFPFMLETKLFPINTWVGGAYKGAGYSFGASMSGIAAAAGGAVLIRIIMTLAGENSAFAAASGNMKILLIAAGSLTVLSGEIAAFTEKNFKKVLAYSSVGQMGIIAIGIGIASEEALKGVLFLILNHSAAKILLFTVAGLFSRLSGKDNWEDMKGIGRTYPVAAAFFVIGAMSLFGIPMFAGFWGKLYLIKSAFVSGGTAAAGAAAILIGTVFEGVYFMKIGHSMFEKSGLTFEKKHCPSFALPAVSFTLIIIAVGLFPAVISNWIDSSVKEFLNPVNDYFRIIISAGGSM